MAANGVPIIAIISRILIVFGEDAALSTVMLLVGFVVEYNKYGNTSVATIISNIAMVTDELINANLNLPLFSSRGIFAIANTITTGTTKNGGLFLKKSVRCGT